MWPIFLVASSAADTGLCSGETAVGGSWTGSSCHYDVIENSPLSYCDVGGLRLLACAEGSSLGHRGQLVESHIGEWYCDFSPSGELVGGVLSGYGSHCCDGVETRVVTAGRLDGTCIASAVPRPDTPSGCQHVPVGQVASVIGFVLLFTRRRVS